MTVLLIPWYHGTIVGLFLFWFGTMVPWHLQYNHFGILPFKLTELDQKPILAGKIVTVFWDAING